MADTGTLDRDVAWLRRMAQAGRQGPPLGGALLAAFGGFIGLGCAALWLKDSVSQYLPFTGMEFVAGLLVFAVIASSGDVSPRRLRRALIWSLAAAAGFWIMYGFGVPLFQQQAWNSAPMSLRGMIYAYIPWALVLAGLGVIIATILRLRRRPAAIAPGNVVAGALWSGGMLAMAAIIAAFLMLHATLGDRLPAELTDPRYGLPGAALFSVIPVMFWVIWALAWWVWGLTAGRFWALFVAAGSAAVAIWYALTLAVFPTSTAGLLLLAFIPGLVLIREARRDDDARPAGAVA